MDLVKDIVALAAELGMKAGLPLPAVLLFLAAAAVLLIVGPRAVAAARAAVKPEPPRPPAEWGPNVTQNDTPQDTRGG